MRAGRLLELATVVRAGEEEELLLRMLERQRKGQTRGQVVSECRVKLLRLRLRLRKKLLLGGGCGGGCLVLMLVGVADWKDVGEGGRGREIGVLRRGGSRRGARGRGGAHCLETVVSFNVTASVALAHADAPSTRSLFAALLLGLAAVGASLLQTRPASFDELQVLLRCHCCFACCCWIPCRICFAWCFACVVFAARCLCFSSHNFSLLLCLRLCSLLQGKGLFVHLASRGMVDGRG